ncbi:MAG: right-handed parallel beta-helix repeat-containing protein [Chitinivibrionales bacterium]|nr:right-handed parallel beta-helix repeat-containing protein [Chitinivibrionales bacterium]
MRATKPVLFLFITAILVGPAFAAMATFYVSPTGSDQAAGTQSAPFATLAKAMAAVKTVNASMTGDIVVYLRGGSYMVTSTLAFAAADGGKNGFNVIYRAYPGEKPVISGGRQISGFTGTGNIKSVTIPEVSAGTWYFNSLFVNDNRATRARSSILTMAAANGAGNSFTYGGSDMTDYQNPADVMVTWYEFFATYESYISSLNTSLKSVTLSSSFPYPLGQNSAGDGNRYFVENAYELLDSPGEWYLNRQTGVLYYYPLPGENMNAATVIAPALTQTLIQLSGTSSQKIQYLNFDGLTFSHTDPNLPHTGSIDNSSQAASHQKAAIMATNIQNCSFKNCEIAHAGEFGIWLGDGCTYDLIQNCNIHDLGAGGIKIGTENTALDGHNTIDNNYVHDGGYIFGGATGITIFKNSYNTISHNEVCNFYYTGISVGWNWGYGTSTAHDNIVEYNSIHDVLKGMLNDGGAIYTLGESPGTIIRHNLIHDVNSYANGWGYGIYGDEGSSSILIENNVVYKVNTGLYNLHYGQNNTVRNNIFAFSANWALSIGRVDKNSSCNINHNIIYTTSSSMYFPQASAVTLSADYNVYYNPNGALSFLGNSFANWQTLGEDQHSVVADPLFVNPNSYDFNLQQNSPAYQLGFKAIDISAVGLYKNGTTGVFRGDGVPVIAKSGTVLTATFSRANSRLMIALTLQESAAVKLALYDGAGRMVKQLKNEVLTAGAHCLSFTLDKLFAPGVYFVRCTSGAAMVMTKAIKE